jgi:predicted dehydrogenase
MNIGVMGAGAICPVYLQYLTRRPEVRVVAVADLVLDHAVALARQFGVPDAVTPERLLAREDVELVLNLTVPRAHAAVSRAALEAGKHVYSEKPLAVDLADGLQLVQLARKTGRHIACAPDTVLGGGLQTAKRVLDIGVVGRPVGAHLTFMNHGHEHWHPHPDFYYQPGGGPVLDMGPYYLTALVALVAPVRRVTSWVQTTFLERTITSQPRAGTRIPVEVPTHVVGVLETSSGVTASVMMSFDVWHHRLPHLEIYGTEGTLDAPDPNGFGGPVMVRRAADPEWQTVPLRPDLPATQARGLGVVEMVRALQAGRAPRLDAALALHVLEVLTALQRGGTTSMTTTIEQPEPMSEDEPWT